MLFSHVSISGLLVSKQFYAVLALKAYRERGALSLQESVENQAWKNQAFFEEKT